jgi:hypothetical protein
MKSQAERKGSGEALSTASTSQGVLNTRETVQQQRVAEELRACTTSLKHAIAAHVQTIHHDLQTLQRGNEMLMNESQKHSDAALAVSEFVSVRFHHCGIFGEVEIAPCGHDGPGT